MVINDSSWQIVRSKYIYIDFDGSNDYISCGNDSSLWSTSLTKFSFSFWVLFDNAWDTNFRTLLDHAIGSAQGFGCFLMDTTAGGNVVQFGIRNSVGTFFAAEKSGLSLGRWHHIVCTYDNSLISENIKIYVDGVLGTAGNGLSDDLTEAINLSADLRLSNSSTDLDGRMRDFKFWKTKALSQAEVTEEFTLKQMTEARVPSYWLKMDENTGNPADTISGFTKVGTLTNGPIWANAKNVGGPPSLDPADVIDMAKENNLFPALTGLQQINGATQYRMFYIRCVTSDPAVIIPEVSLLLQKAGNKNGYTTVQWAFDPLAYSTYKYRPFKYFNGSSTFVQIDETEPGGDQEDILDMEGGFVIAAWFRTYNGYTVSEDKGLVSKGNSSGPDFFNYVLFMNTSEGIGGGYRDGAGVAHYVNSPRPYNDGFWHHAIIAWDSGNGVRLFMDGFQVAQTASLNAPDLHDQPLLIGKFPSGGFFEGYIDEVRTWLDSGTFTAAEARKIYWENQTTLSFENSWRIEKKFGTDNGIIDTFGQVMINGGAGPFGSPVWQNELHEIPDPPNIGKTNNVHFFPIIVKMVSLPNAEDIKNDQIIFNYHFTTPVGETAEGGNEPSGGTGGSGDGNGEPQTPPANDPVTACVAGDWGCENTTDKIVDLIQDQNPTVVLDCGDKGYDKVACWMSHLKPILSKVLDSRGNHDSEAQLTTLKGLMGGRIFGGSGKQLFWYYRIIENIAFIAMDTEASFSSGSTQHKHIQEFFTKIKNNKNILWKVIFMHKPFFGTDSDKHGYNEDNIVQTYQPIFDANDVDFVCFGHIHNIEVTYPVKYNSNDAESPRATDTTNGPYDSKDGAIYIRNGTGGHDSGDDLYKFEASKAGFSRYINDDENGIVTLVWSNNNKTCTLKVITLDRKTRLTMVVNK